LFIRGCFISPYPPLIFKISASVIIILQAKHSGSNEWIFIDVNNLPPFRTNKEEELASRISAAFDSVSDYVGFSAKIYSTFDNKHMMDGIISGWQLKDTWHNAHTLTSDKINIKADRASTTLLYLASQYGHLEVVKALLDHRDIDVNQARSNGVTPLHAATQNGHLEVVEVLRSWERSTYINGKRSRDEDGSDKQRPLMFSEGARKRQRTNDEEVGNDDSNQPIHVNRIPNF
jgi:hypothetical protein